LKLRKIHTKT